jgi:hypothetical protein
VDRRIRKQSGVEPILSMFPDIQKDQEVRLKERLEYLRENEDA